MHEQDPIEKQQLPDKPNLNPGVLAKKIRETMERLDVAFLAALEDPERFELELK